MNILIDAGHHDFLNEGLVKLLSDRLGHKVYQPVGLEWFKEGFWHLSPNPKSARQMLVPSANPYFGELEPGERRSGDAVRLKDESLRYANILKKDMGGGLYEITNAVFPNRIYNGITLPRFKAMKFDIIMATIPQDIMAWLNLKQRFQTRAKFIFQVGNNWKIPQQIAEQIPNILNSTTTIFPNTTHHVRYKQEFDLELFKKEEAPAHPKSMVSMMNYCIEPQPFYNLESKLGPEWHTKIYGAGNRDKIAGPEAAKIADIFKRDMGWLYHVKAEQEGFGFSIFGAAATGRPIIYRGNYFKNTTCECLLEHSISAIDIDLVGEDGAARIMSEAAISGYQDFSDAIYKKFQANVNYEDEAARVKTFIESLR